MLPIPHRIFMGFKEKINLNVYPNADSMRLFMSIFGKINYLAKFFIWQNGEEIQLTIERLNAMYVISREAKYPVVDISVAGKHYGTCIAGMAKTQGMDNLMNSN